MSEWDKTIEAAATAAITTTTTTTSKADEIWDSAVVMPFVSILEWILLPFCL